ncbi:MAG: HAMP domain-containing protein [Pseudomonadales bacterium]|nr:HAMP domain-containing protein [Halioglobus sp.]MCP5129715.1 HAMP domain-containing protein [Pseudomonadales bacterium]
MTPRIPLFGKIFLGFWLVTIVVFASWLLTSRYFDSGPDRGAVEHRSKEPPQRFILQMVYELQNLDEAELQPLLARASAKHDVDIFLLDEGEVDILGRAVPDKVSAVARKLRPPRRRAFLRTGGEHLFAQQIYRPDHGMLRAVFVFRPSRHQFLRLLGSNLWLRTGLTILISGVICYLLSRLLTNRIKTLQAASRQLATGHLDTRLRVRERGGDETDELARDFNSMAQQLQERIGAQKRLLTDVSHELRSPLARLRIALALAQEKPEKLPDYLQRMERETERLEALIDQLLRSQGEALELDSHIDLVALLRQLCDDANFEGAAQGKRLLLQHDFPQAMVESSGDLLHKSFENILRNALAHTREHTEVNVSITGDRDSYQVCVTDHGGGIPEQELDKIFEAFYRTDVARSRDTGGFGLGLAIARRAILRHGGQVSAVNTKTGLAVTVTLPRNRPPQEA